MQQNVGWGECRRRAPVADIHDRQLRAAFPATNIEDFCGSGIHQKDVSVGVVQRTNQEKGQG